MVSFKDAKVGDKVWCYLHGWGVIDDIHDGYSIYPLFVKFNNGISELFSVIGNSDIKDINPVLFHSEDEFFTYADRLSTEPALAIPKSDIEQKAGGTLYIGDNSFHSSHYHGKIEPIDLISSNKLDFNRASIIKYAFRAGKKSGQEKLDIKKIIDYALLLANQEDIELQKEEIIELINYRYNWVDSRKEK